MTLMGESLREAHRPTRSLATPKSRMRVGCWNVRTMYTVGKAAQIVGEMERYRLDLMGLSISVHMSKTDIESSMVAATHSKRHNFTNNRREKDK